MVVIVTTVPMEHGESDYHTAASACLWLLNDSRVMLLLTVVG